MTPTPLAWIEAPAPHEALARLRAEGRLATDLPEVDALYGVPQSPAHHPEIDTGIHTELCLKVAEQLGASPRARFAVLVHDLGKALTPRHEWPKHIDHEHRGVAPVRAVCERLAVPADWARLALLVCELHLNAHRALEMRAGSVVRLLQHPGLADDDGFFDDFVVACESDKRGRAGLEGRAYPQGRLLRAARRELLHRPCLEGEDRHSQPHGVRTWNERLAAVARVQDECRAAA